MRLSVYEAFWNVPLILFFEDSPFCFSSQSNHYPPFIVIASILILKTNLINLLITSDVEVQGLKAILQWKANQKFKLKYQV